MKQILPQSLQKEPTLLTPRSQTSRLQNYFASDGPVHDPDERQQQPPLRSGCSC